MFKTSNSKATALIASGALLGAVLWAFGDVSDALGAGALLALFGLACLLMGAMTPARTLGIYFVCIPLFGLCLGGATRNFAFGVGITIAAAVIWAVAAVTIVVRSTQETERRLNNQPPDDNQLQ